MDVPSWIGFGVAIVVMLLGMLGTVVPVLPGIPLIWITMLVFAIFERFERIDGAFLAVTFVVMVAAEVADQLGRLLGARRFGASKAGAWGAVLGSFVGLFFLPLGLLLGPFLGVVIAELFTGRTTADQSGRDGADFIGSLSSMAVKLVVGIGLIIAFLLKVL